MAVMKSRAMENPNGSVLSPPPSAVEDVNGQDFAAGVTPSAGVAVTHRELSEEATLYSVFNHLIESIFDTNLNQDSTATMVNRIKESLLETAPLFREAVHNAQHDVLLWTARGSPLHALFVVSVGTITLIALTGMLVFMLFFAATIVNAILISLLISLTAVGGFLAVFFSCLTAVYTWALCIAASATFTVTISLIIAALVAAGCTGIIWIVWLARVESSILARRSLNIVGQALPTNVSTQYIANYWRESGEALS